MKSLLGAIATIAIAAALMGCGSEPVAKEDPEAAAKPKVSKGGNADLAQQAPEMTPPPNAPTADQVVGSKGGGN